MVHQLMRPHPPESPIFWTVGICQRCGPVRRPGQSSPAVSTWTKRLAPGSVNTLRNDAKKVDHCRNSDFSGPSPPRTRVAVTSAFVPVNTGNVSSKHAFDSGTYPAKVYQWYTWYTNRHGRDCPSVTSSKGPQNRKPHIDYRTEKPELIRSADFQIWGIIFPMVGRDVKL